MSAVTEAITASIIGGIDPSRKTDGQIISMWFDQQKSSYQQHMESECSLCKGSASGQCKLADKLEQLFDKVYLSK